MIPVLFLILNIFYIFLQSQYIFGGDSGEYARIALTGGVAHPPGYPLYSLLAHLTTIIVPFGSVPWKVALLSSIPTILTAYLIFKILSFIKMNTRIALLSSLLYLFLFPVWQYALVPEVFGLHTFLVMFVTYLLLRYISRNKHKYLLFSSFLLGLCISHHHIFILFTPGWLLLLKGKIQKIIRNRQLIKRIFLLFVLGVSFYFYAIYAGLNLSVINWEDTTTVKGVFQLISRSAYGSFKAYSGSGGHIVNQLSDIISGLVFILLDFKPLGIVFICIGVIKSKKIAKSISLFLASSVIVHFAFLFYTNFVLTTSISAGMYERFLIPLYALLTIYLAIGLNYIFYKLTGLTNTIIRNSTLTKIINHSFFIFIGIYITIIASQNYKSISYIANSKVVERFAKDLIATIPKGGILLTQGDTSTFSVYYRLFGFNERKDITPFLLGLASKKQYINMIKKRSPALILNGPLRTPQDIEKFIYDNRERGIYSDYKTGIGVLRPFGLLWKYYPDEVSASSESASLLSNNSKLWNSIYTIPLLNKQERNIFNINSVNIYYVKSYIDYSKLLVSLGKNEEAEIVLKNIAEIYQKDTTQNFALYLNILVFNNKCAKATQVAQKLNIERTIKENPTFVKSALGYLNKCDPQNKNISRYNKILLENESNFKGDLKSF